jgi:hypothetical protein
MLAKLKFLLLQGVEEVEWDEEDGAKVVEG